MTGGTVRALRAAIAVAAVVAGLPLTAQAHDERPPTIACVNEPTGETTRLHAPYAPPEVEAAQQERWAGSEQPADTQFSYLAYVPSTLPEGPVPVVMTVHGLLGSAKQHEEQTQWRQTADAHGFVLVAPNGHRSWDYTQGSYDIAYLRDVVADVRTNYCVDERRIYATGHSNGAFITHRLACDAGDLFAAGASYAAGDVSGLFNGGPCPADGRDTAGDPIDGWAPVPIAMWHGDDDAIVGYAAGRRGLHKWLERYDCDTTPEAVGDDFGSVETYGSCTAGDFDVVFRTLDGHGHAWPDGCGGQQSGTGGSLGCEPEPGTGPWPSATDLTEELWAYLSAHARIEPAVAQAAPLAPGPGAGIQPDDVPAWAGQGMTSGFDSEATFRRTAPLAETADGLRVDLVFRVAYGGDGAGVGATHPVCPTSNPGPGTQSMEGRIVSVSATDTDGARQTVEVETEPFVDPVSGEHLERVTADLVGEFDPTATVLRARYAGDLLKFWWGCGTPEAHYKETIGTGGPESGGDPDPGDDEDEGEGEHGDEDDGERDGDDD